jgi:hypothetical protein
MKLGDIGEALLVKEEYRCTKMHFISTGEKQGDVCHHGTKNTVEIRFLTVETAALIAVSRAFP